MPTPEGRLMRNLAPNAYADPAPSLAPTAAEPITFDLARARLDDFLIRHFELNATVVLIGVDVGSPDGDWSEVVRITPAEGS